MMKKLLPFLILALSIVTVRAQTNAPAASAQSTNSPATGRSEPLTTELSRKVQPQAIIPLQSKPNEILLGKVKVSGIAVEAAKTKQPLKLINPFSPPVNSSPEDNVVRDPFNGKVNGLKVFAIHF
jgi:hypothetical protein